MYIYLLPYEERKQLCFILDQNNKWEELGGCYMKYDQMTIDTIKKEIFRGNSPTNELLTIWGHQNHTVLELFILLSRMKHYQAMTALKHLVDKNYWCLIKDGDENLNTLMKNLAMNKKICNNNRDSKIRAENFNNDSEKIINVPQMLLQPVVSKENNESIVDNRLLQPKSPVPPLRLGTSKMFTASDISCVAESAGAIPHIPYEELERSTHNWDNNAVLGKGGFGTVYKGTWKCTQVAIKRLEQKADKPEYHSEQIKQSITELHCLNAYRHDNVLPLYGYSIGGPPSLPHLPIHGRRLLGATPAGEGTLAGFELAHQAEHSHRGLQFLHTSMINGKPLVHGDIKSANILLDPNDQPRIGDFGLAREGPQSQYTYIKVSRIHGTRPYLPDEFLRAKKFSTKVDTYMLTRTREDKFLKDHVVNYAGDVLDLKDKRSEGYDECFKGLVEIGKMCVNKRAKERPEMVSVLILLEGVSTK
ncbi:hypothetical protein NQ318_017874 [Aromia moschata]|uniref:Protein kinase domain-containing protein n=1 Tax=Aromia moschata TaxID=1265417 RepID=A0AAV8YAS3_9CUCU|nr:hypothetical protein NQ318_017874 [Aromia moschata]